MSAQLTLLDFLPGGTAERNERAAAPLICLRDEVPYALEAVVNLSYWRRTDDTSPSAGGEWAYIVCRAGLRYERASEWWPTGGWHRKPKNLLTWAALAALIGEDPRRAEVCAWADSLTAPDRWHDLYRPHQIWSSPGMWHPSYIAGDHERAGWDARIAAWRTVLAILTDAIDRVSLAGAA